MAEPELVCGRGPLEKSLREHCGGELNVLDGVEVFVLLDEEAEQRRHQVAQVRFGRQVDVRVGEHRRDQSRDSNQDQQTQIGEG